MLEYEDMTLKEKAGFVSHAVASLTEELYYVNDRTGLEVLIKNLELVLGHARDCLDCLELIGKSDNVLKKVMLLLEYVGVKDMDEDFVHGLEEMTTQAHEDWVQSTDAAISEADEAEMVKRLKGLIQKHTEDGKPEHRA